MLYASPINLSFVFYECPDDAENYIDALATQLLLSRDTLGPRVFASHQLPHSLPPPLMLEGTGSNATEMKHKRNLLKRTLLKKNK